jgi:hypothetical protein
MERVRLEAFAEREVRGRSLVLIYEAHCAFQFAKRVTRSETAGLGLG